MEQIRGVVSLEVCPGQKESLNLLIPSLSHRRKNSDLQTSLSWDIHTYVHWVQNSAAFSKNDHTQMSACAGQQELDVRQSMAIVCEGPDT